MKFIKSAVFALIFLSSLSLSCQSTTEPEKVATTTLILVRHAEKDAEPADDPSLTEQGKARAEKLKSMLAEVPVEAVYTTPYNRNRETVGPLAASKGLEALEYDPRNDAGRFLDEVLRKHRGKYVVICGHSNTVPVLLNYLTRSEKYQQLAETEYEDLFIVSVQSPGEAVVTNLNFTP